MTEWLLALVPQVGPWLLGGAVFLSCFALPIPASILLLAAGGFAAVGDLVLAQVAGAAFAGVVAGDHSVYALGRLGGPRLTARIGRRRGGALARARAALARRGGTVVFLSRWLLSPIGPYVNFVAGAVQLPWTGFLVWATAGELVWLSVYLGTGYAFTDSLEAASDFAFDLILGLGAAAAAIGLGIWAFGQRRRAA